MYNLSWEDIYFNTSIRGLIGQFFPLYSKKDCCAYGGIAKWSNAADCKSVPSGSIVQIYLPPPLLCFLVWQRQFGEPSSVRYC